MPHILLALSLVAVAGTSGNAQFRDWRFLGEYSEGQACEKAASALGLNPEGYRCLSKDGVVRTPVKENLSNVTNVTNRFQEMPR